jgi:hypothetical protein
MADDYIDIDTMIEDEFLESLDEPKVEEVIPVTPEWVVDNNSHTTYKAWQAILKLKSRKQLGIKSYGKVCTSKTAKSLYEIKKSEIASEVGISAQSIFRTSSFSPFILSFFNEVNAALLIFHEREQQKQKKRQRISGIRSKNKETILKNHQGLEKELTLLKARTTKETLDLVINKMPLDFKLKLGL